MTDRDRRPEGHYGFARGLQAEQARLPEPARLIGADEGDVIAASALSAPRPQPEAVPASPVPGHDNHGWVVRPKKPRPVVASAPTTGLSLRRRRRAVATPEGLPASAAPHDNEARSRSWLVLGFVGMVYLVGIAGLWSMVQTFEDSASSTLTPAAEEGPLPRLDDNIDMRDAHLDDPFVPKLRPLAPFGIEREVAASDL